MSNKRRRRPPAPSEVEGHPCAGLADLQHLQSHRLEVEVMIAERVVHLRREHSTPWEEIGQVLGVTRQAATKKYGSMVEGFDPTATS